ncbi:MAG: 4Fe-4S dicluster domain-containing protein [Firmicutes bacterium]|nr:4Fe-4S dicluster domain-containing protein [Bacillota bacterium]MDH7495090.1 4Fe-4S dicluster domain-containing protein [Bacillota bacterium]
MKLDLDRCTGCRLCELVCSVENFGENNPKKAGIRVISRLFLDARYDVVVCDQCGGCVDSCPVGAISVERGVVVIDEGACTNCGVCVEACPNGALFTHPEVGHPIKCVACGECAALCPRGVLDALAIAGRVAS